MNKYTIKIIDNETQNVETIDCNVIFAGWANSETAGRFSVCNAKGLEMCFAANCAEDEITEKEKENIIFKAARQHLRERKGKIFEEV